MEIHSRGEEGEMTKSEKRVFIIRQILNIIFMVVALVGAALYWFMDDPTMPTLVIMTAVFFKMAECVLRFKR